MKTWEEDARKKITRDGTVGRSDATERSLALRWDVDPVRMMRPRFADSIRASGFGLHQQIPRMWREQTKLPAIPNWRSFDVADSRLSYPCRSGL